MGRLAPSNIRGTPPRTRKLGAAPALNRPARPVYRSMVSRSSVAPDSCSALFKPSATFTRRAALSAAKPARSSWLVRRAAIWPSTAAGRPVPMPSHNSIWARPLASQNCSNASPLTVWPLAGRPAAPNSARNTGRSPKLSIVTVRQWVISGRSRSRRQMRLTSPVSPVISSSVKRVRAMVTETVRRPARSDVTLHSRASRPSPAKSWVTLPSRRGSGRPACPSRPASWAKAPARALYCSVRAVRRVVARARVWRRLRHSRYPWLAAVHRSLGWMHTDSCPGRSSTSTWPLLSSVGFSWYRPSMAVA